MVDSQLIYTSPCNESFNSFLEENLIIVGAVGIAFGLFEVSVCATIIIYSYNLGESGKQ